MPARLDQPLGLLRAGPLRRGERMLRTMICEAANPCSAGAPGHGQRFKDWVMTVKRWTSHKKAVVALTRKLAVMMHAIRVSGGVFAAREA
jgi:transposase